MLRGPEYGTDVNDNNGLVRQADTVGSRHWQSYRVLNYPSKSEISIPSTVWAAYIPQCKKKTSQSFTPRNKIACQKVRFPSFFLNYYTIQVTGCKNILNSYVQPFLDEIII